MAGESTNATARTDDDRRRLLEVVEQLAMIMVESGVPRMAARVYAYVLADDAEIYTAGELSAGLGVSAAGISGAVRYLVQTGLLAKHRVPGDRRDHYRVYDDDVFGAMVAGRIVTLRRWADSFRAASDTLGTDRPGGRRLAEGALFFDFMHADQDALLGRWRKYRDTHGGASVAK